MNYKSVVTLENVGCVYMCKLVDGTELRLQLHDNCGSETIGMIWYDFDNTYSNKYYSESEVAEILKEVNLDDEESDINEVQKLRNKLKEVLDELENLQEQHWKDWKEKADMMDQGASVAYEHSYWMLKEITE